MNSVNMPEDCAQQWEIILLLLSAEEKKIDRTDESEIDTMSYFCRNEGVREILLHWLKQMHNTYARKVSESDTAKKCDEVSLLWRQRGNDKFRANRVEESYRCYCESVLYANQNGPMYPLALANRSAALLRAKRFKECLSDIKLALESGYPREQSHKLLLRRADCHIELNAAEEARTALAEAIEHARLLQLAPTHAAEFDRHVKILEKKLDSLQTEESEAEIILPTCYKGENENFNAASNALELRHSETCGRYVVAREATRRGDVLFSEEPYAWVTLPRDDLQRHSCETCCQSEINPVPCATCSRSVYCGMACRTRGEQLFHRWECGAAQANIFPTIGIAHLALRVLLITASTGFPRAPGGREPTTAAELFAAYACVDNVQIYRKDTPPFYRMFNLITNFNKMNNSDYIQYALTATMLTLYLEHWTTFFDYLLTRVPHSLSASQLRIFAAGLLLRAMGQLVCNGHAALTLATYEDDSGTDDGQSATITEREVRRATAIYPSAAMMNHSCDPNIINTFYKGRLVVVCGREICAGGEVSNCYGPHRAREPAPHRRAALRAQYMFTCACAACSDADRRDFVISVACTWRGLCPEVDCDRLMMMIQYVFTIILTNCYGPHRAREPAPHRRAALRAQYMFTCACAACSDADRRDSVYLFSAYACQSCKGPVTCNPNASGTTRCGQCGADFRIERAMETLDRAKELLVEARRATTPADRCEKAHAALRLQQLVWHRHHTSLRESADKLARLYADHGDFSKSVELIKQNIQSLEYQYGSFSAEVAHELRKLSDVMLERIVSSPHNADYRDWCLETHKIIKKAVQLTELNYGSWEPLVKRLKYNEEYVASLVIDNRSTDVVDSVHHNLHYNLKI